MTDCAPSSRAYTPAWTGPAPAVGEHDEVTGIVALLDGDLADEIGHLVLDHAGGATGRLDDPQAEAAGQRRQAGQGRLAIQAQAPSQELLGIEVAKDEGGIGHRGLLCPLARSTRVPGSAPADTGPTRRLPLDSSSQMMLPPPLPMERMSIRGTKYSYWLTTL